MSDYQPAPTDRIEHGRVYTRLARSAVTNGVGALDASALDTDPKPGLSEFVVRTKASGKTLADGTGYDIAELLIRKIETNLHRQGGRASNLAGLGLEGIDVFGFELAVEAGAGPSPFAPDLQSGTIGLQVVWLTTTPDGTANGPYVYAFATFSGGSPTPLSTPSPAPRRGTSGRFFVASWPTHLESTEPSDWEALLPSLGVDAATGGGLVSGSGGLFGEKAGLLVGTRGWYQFTVDLRYSLRQVENSDLLFTEECFLATSYDHHPWLMGALGLTNAPVDGFSTTASPWTPPRHVSVPMDEGLVPDWDAGRGVDHRGAEDSQFDHFVDVSGSTFTVDGERFHVVGGNHPDLRTKSPQRIGAWLQQWKRAVPEFNTLRTTAFGSGIPEQSDCLPLVPRIEQNGGQWELVHSDAAFERLDDLVYQCGKHGVRLILMLDNYRSWHGGISQYVEWLNEATGSDHDPGTMASHDLFYSDSRLKRWFKSHIDRVLDHTNRYTGVQYKHDPTIMLWELANEVRTRNATTPFKNWVTELSDYIDGKWSGDRTQLVAIGSGDFPTPPGYYTDAHEAPNVDAWSTHVWAGPKHWDTGIAGGSDCIKTHRAEAKEQGMPMYIGEIGWRAERSGADADPVQMTERNEALGSWFEEIRRPADGYTVDGTLVWETRLLEEYSTMRELESFGWTPTDIYPTDSETVSLMW